MGKKRRPDQRLGAGESVSEFLKGMVPARNWEADDQLFDTKESAEAHAEYKNKLFGSNIKARRARRRR